MEQVVISLAVEDQLSEAVLKKILRIAEDRFLVTTCYSREGFGYLKKNIAGFNNAAKGMPFLVLTDLDTSECPPALIKEWLPYPKHPNLIFRVAVREVEAWILADWKGFAMYIGISNDIIPADVESIKNPKQKLIELTKKSRNRRIRESIVPGSNSDAKQGPDYNGALITFVNEFWDIKTAMENSISLKKTVKAVIDFKPVYSVQ
ncbi:MAG: DUF4276 family protein [Nitrospinae bacterium]|nr:DUF4276 family protein [Nitrospinota bacterium]